MANLFGNRGAPVPERQILKNRYATARHMLILVAVLTALNVFLTATNSDSYFLFSASLPIILTVEGMFYCGKLPEDFYTGEFAGMEFLDESVFFVLAAISVAIAVSYFVLWILSAKGRGVWLLVSLILFSLDTLLMFGYYGIDLSMLTDIIIHVIVIIFLVSGVIAHHKLKDLPDEEFFVMAAEEMAAQSEADTEGDVNDIK